MALLICAFGHDVQKPSHWVTKYAYLDNEWLPDPSEWKYGILLAAEEVVRAGVLSYVPGSESEKFHLFHPSWIGQVLFFGWCLFVGGGFCCLVFGLAR